MYVTTGSYANIPLSPQPCPCCGRCPTCGQYKPNTFTYTGTRDCGNIPNTTTAEAPFTYT